MLLSKQASLLMWSTHPQTLTDTNTHSHTQADLEAERSFAVQFEKGKGFDLISLCTMKTMR